MTTIRGRVTRDAGGVGPSCGVDGHSDATTGCEVEARCGMDDDRGTGRGVEGQTWVSLSNTIAGGWTGATNGERGTAFGASYGIGGEPYGVGICFQGVSTLTVGLGAGGVVLLQSIEESAAIIIRFNSELNIGDELLKRVSGSNMG